MPYDGPEIYRQQWEDEQRRNYPQEPTVNQITLEPDFGPIPNPNATGASKAINDLNPQADPSKPYVQYGNTGGWIDGIGETVGAGSSLTQAQYDNYYREAVAGGVPDAWMRDFLARNPYDPHRALAAYRSEQTNSGPDQQAGGSGAGTGAGAGTTRQSNPPFQNTSPLFDDPASRLLEDYALDRFGQRMNPDPNSGTAMYEQYAKELINTLKGPVYSAQDESIIKGKAINQIGLEQDQTTQQWLEELSRRGIPPSSGVALDGILKIKNHFAGLRTTVESEFARGAIDATRQQRFQALDTTGKLANSEESRLREAGTYAAMPLELQNNAFQRNLQLVGAGGSPTSVLQSLLQVANQINESDRYSEEQQAELFGSLIQWLEENRERF